MFSRKHTTQSAQYTTEIADDLAWNGTKHTVHRTDNEQWISLDVFIVILSHPPAIWEGRYPEPGAIMVPQAEIGRSLSSTNFEAALFARRRTMISRINNVKCTMLRFELLNVVVKTKRCKTHAKRAIKTWLVIHAFVTFLSAGQGHVSLLFIIHKFGL